MRVLRWVLGLLCIPLIIVIGLGLMLRGAYLNRKDRKKQEEQ